MVQSLATLFNRVGEENIIPIQRREIKIYNLQRRKQKNDTIKSNRDNSDEHSI